MGRLGDTRRDKMCRRCALRKARRQCPEAIERSMPSRRRWTRCAGRSNASMLPAASCTGAGRGVDCAGGSSLGTGECAKLARYLRPRAGSGEHSVLPRLEALGEQCSMPAVRLGCLCWYLRALGKRPSHARKRALSRHLLAAYAQCPGSARARRCSMPSRPRESRRALYVHKGATQGFLDLFRNLRTRRHPRPPETGQRVPTGSRCWLPSPSLA